MAKNILVIGGNRFFGKHLVSQLLEQGHKPVLFNRQKSDDGFGSQVERINGDRDDYDSLHVVASSKKWDFVFDQVCFTANQAEVAVSHFTNQVGRYIVTSTQSVYDYGVNLNETAFDPYHYQFSKTNNPDYAEGKRQMEATFYQKAKFPVVAVRFPIVLGEDDYTKRLHWHFDRLKTNKGVHFPHLKARMVFVDSKEAGKILSLLPEVDWTRPLNVASPEPISMKDLLEMIENQMRKKFKFDSQAGNENVSPFGIKNDWFMNVDQLKKLNLKISPLMNWLPNLLKAEAKLLLQN